MANKPHVDERMLRLILKRERVHLATSAKATARMLGIEYRVVRRCIAGDYLTKEQWEVRRLNNGKTYRRDGVAYTRHRSKRMAPIGAEQRGLT